MSIQVDDTLNLFEELQSLHLSVATKTKTLHDACDQLVCTLFSKILNTCTFAILSVIFLAFSD